MSLFRDLKRAGVAGLERAGYISVTERQLIHSLGIGGKPPVFVDLTGVRMEREDLVPVGEEEFIPPFDDAWFEWRDQKFSDNLGDALGTVGARVSLGGWALRDLFDVAKLPEDLKIVQIIPFVRFTTRGPGILPMGLSWTVVDQSGRRVRLGSTEYSRCSACVRGPLREKLWGPGEFLNPSVVLWGGVPGLKSELQHFLEGAVSVVEHACTMLNARNVALTKPAMGKKQARKQRRGLTWHRLVIVAPGVKARHGAVVPASEGEVVTRQHLQRGHFKVYTDEAPLFGKFSGRFWWSPHIRGSQEAGVVLKDYAVTESSLKE